MVQPYRVRNHGWNEDDGAFTTHEDTVTLNTPEHYIGGWMIALIGLYGPEVTFRREELHDGGISFTATRPDENEYAEMPVYLSTLTVYDTLTI